MIVWLLELLYSEKLVGWKTYATESLESEIPQQQMVPSLLYICAVQIAKTLESQEMSSQKAVLNSVNFYLQKQIMIELLILSSDRFLQWDCKSLANFFISKNEKFRAFKILQRVFNRHICILISVL